MKIFIISFIFLLLLTSITFAGQITKTYYFDEPELIADSIFTRIEIEDGVVTGTPGYPAFPYRGISLLLQQNESVYQITIEKGNQISLGTHLVYPIQRQIPISDTTGIGFTEPDPVIYESSEQYPAEQNTDFSTHYLAGYSVGFLAITPFSYIPVAGELYYFESITVTVETDYNEAAETASNKFLFKNTQIDKRLKILVENYEDKDSFYNITKERPDSAYDYVIVTSEEYADDFQPLADFHSSRGYRTKIELIGNIIINYPGVDDQDKLRNYLIDQYTQAPIQFVLLGGDTATDDPSNNIIPHRGLYVSLPDHEDDDIPADMYYACLDRSSAPGYGPDWNNDNDNNWGEPGEADLLSEFYIGRICINNSTEIANFISKTTLYSETPVYNGIWSALLVGEMLDFWVTYGGNYMNELIGGCSNSGYTTVGIPGTWTVRTLYEMSGTWSSFDLYNQLNLGPNLLNHIGHGSTTHCLNIDNPDLTTLNITNNGISRNFFNGYSQACYSGSMDNRDYDGTYVSDCFMEKITTMETAAVTFVANSRYGFYSTGCTSGASQLFNREWVDSFFDDGIYSIAGANQNSKEKSISVIEADRLYRWCCYELNVFGDPAVELWTSYPTEVNAYYNNVLFIGQDYFNVTCNNSQTGRVAIYFNDEMIGAGYLTDGFAQIPIFNPPADTGTATLSILAHNHYFYEDEISVIPFTYAVIRPDTIMISELTEVNITVYQDARGTPLPGVNIEAYGPGIFGDTLGITDENGFCTLNFGSDYSGDDIIGIRGWESESQYYLFDEPIFIINGNELAHPELYIITENGILAKNINATLHAVVGNDSCKLWAKINNNEWLSTINDSMEIIPDEIGTLTAMIAKAGYNSYREDFDIIEVLGIASGIVSDTIGNVIPDAQIIVYPNYTDTLIPPVVTTTTDSNGYYAFDHSIPVDYYRFKINKGYSYKDFEEIFFVDYGDNIINIEVEPDDIYTVIGCINYEGEPELTTIKIYRDDTEEPVDTLYTDSGIFIVDLFTWSYLFVVESQNYNPIDSIIIVNEDLIQIFELILHDFIKEVPNEFLLINDAINDCIDGDTVLVYPGTYYENVNFNGKNITLTSLFFSTKDISYIDSTIISGHPFGGSVVSFTNGEDSTAILSGFTICNGNNDKGGGVYCNYGSNPCLQNLKIIENTADYGAGLYCENSSPNLSNVTLSNNISNYSGGGVYCREACTTLENCILWNNIPQEIYLDLYGDVIATYSDIQGVWTGVGNISDDPRFTDPDNGDYSLEWNDTVRSPCIDTGDPDIVYNDADETRSDMGAIPAITHNYDSRTLHEGWNWFSFPVLDMVTTGNVDALIALDPILDNMEICKIEEKEVWWNADSMKWVNDIGDFRSVDGYKIEMNAPDTLPVSGFLEDPDAVITLEAEAEYGNWIGYFIEHSMEPRVAFSQVWDTLTYIKAEDWAMFNKQGQWWGTNGTVDYGKSYVVGCSGDCNFTWGISVQPVDPYEKSETLLFIYEEQSDYMPIFVDSTEALNGIDEIGIFLEDECIGASVIEGFPVFIPAYADDDSTQTKGGNELTFQVASYGKSKKRSIPAFLYNEAQNVYVEKPVFLDNNSYAIVRLGAGAGVELPKEFTLYQNYPNPFSCNFGKSTTTISFIPSPEAENFEIKIYNIKGQLVREFLNVAPSPSLPVSVTWDGKDDHGTQLGNGIYFYKVSSGKKSAIKKMVILR